jgi:hypothetical protein
MGSNLLNDLKNAIKNKVPSSILYYFLSLGILNNTEDLSIMTIIESAVKLSLVRTLFLDGVLVSLIKRELTEKCQFNIQAMVDSSEVFTIIRKGMMHAGEKSTVIRAAKLARSRSSAVANKRKAVEDDCKDIDQIVVLAFEIVTKEMTRLR